MVFSAVDLYIWPKLTLVVDSHFGAIQNGATGVQIDLFAKLNIDAIGAMEWRFYDGVLGGDKPTEFWSDCPSLFGWQNVVLMHR